MPTRFSLFLLVAAIACGCSKSGGKADAGAGSAAATTATKSAPEVQMDLTDISQKLNAQQYEQAVGTLAVLHGMPMSEKDKAVYDKQVQQTLDALSAKAAQGDQRALESYRMLGHMMTGR